MKILIDTNVVLDFAFNREPFASDAAEIFRHIEQKKISATVSASAITDIFYILHKRKVDAFAFLKDFLLDIDVLGVDKMIIMYALYSGWTDFEDAVQAQVSIENHVDIIVTRNITDFEKLANIKVLTPSELLLHLTKNTNA